MTSLMFVMPVHGRLPLASICLRQLRRTCDALSEHGVYASALIVADTDNLERLEQTLPDFAGFGWLERDNEFLSRRFNDGLQLACDPAHNQWPADFAVPIGSDDWVDWRLFVDLPRPNTIIGFQRISFVREDGREITSRQVRYEGGCGIRIIPRYLLKAAGYRPADEDRKRACDTSILVNLRRLHGDRMHVRHAHSDALQIVDWKTDGEQLNTYHDVAVHRPESSGDPFDRLAEYFPAESLDEMRAHYGVAELVAA